MSKSIGMLLVLGSMFAVGGVACSSSGSTTGGDSSAKAADTSKAGGGDAIGVKECDDYIAKWKDCYKDPAMKSAAQPAFDQLVKSWKETAAKGGAEKDALKTGCKTVLDSFPSAACK